MLDHFARARAERIIEDVLRAHPHGAPTMVLHERLLRAGYAMPQIHDVLAAMRARDAARFEAGAWRRKPARAPMA